MDGVAKAMARNRAENKQCIKLASSCHDYMMSELEQQDLKHRDALNTLTEGLTKAKDDAHVAKVRTAELLKEKLQWEKKKEQEIAPYAEQFEGLNMKVADLEAQLAKARVGEEFWKKQTEEAAKKGASEFKAIVERAWAHASEGSDFALLDSFISYEIECEAAIRDKKPLPPLPKFEVMGDEEAEGEEGEEQERDSSGSLSDGSSDSNGRSSEDNEEKTPPRD